MQPDADQSQNKPLEARSGSPTGSYNGRLACRRLRDFPRWHTFVALRHVRLFVSFLQIALYRRARQKDVTTL